MTAPSPVIIWDIDDVWHPWMSLSHQASIESGLVLADAVEPVTWQPWEEYATDLQDWVEALDVWTLDGRLYQSTPPQADVRAFNRLWALGADHHFVTARGFFGTYPDIVRHHTKTWVADNFPVHTVSSLHFSQDKGEQVQLLRATHAIDDSVKNWQAMTDAGARTYIMTRPWNIGADIPDELRVNSVAEFCAAIEKETSQ